MSQSWLSQSVALSGLLWIVLAAGANAPSPSRTVRSSATSQRFIACTNATDDIVLAVQPECGALSTAKYAEINTGVKPASIKTIIAFGDSWTSNGSNGTVPFAPVVFPPNPSAGARQGNNQRARASNGYTWVEDLANTIGAKLVNYAVGGAVIDLNAYNTTNHGTTYTSDNLRRTSLVEEVQFFDIQGKYVADLTPETTLYTFSFGINDMGQLSAGGGDYAIAKSSFVNAIRNVITVHNAKNILVQSVYDPTSAFNTAVQYPVFAELVAQHARSGVNFAWTDLSRLFGAITASNTTMAKFGYAGTTCLLTQNTTVGGCDDPDHYIYWIPGHPSVQTHELINQYTLAVLNSCLL